MRIVWGCLDSAGPYTLSNLQLAIEDAHRDGSYSVTDKSKRPIPSLKNRLEHAKFDVEHALGMYADSYCTLPAEAIYDKRMLAPFISIIESCHIYLIGLVPVIDFNGARQQGDQLELSFTVLGNNYTVKYDLPKGLLLKREEGYSYLEDSSGQRYWPKDDDIQARLNSESRVIDFDVKYIGQAYGQDGSRNALDRLLKHETLQKISLKGIPQGHRLTLLLLSIQPSNQLITMFNPFAQSKDEDGSRMQSGLDKLFNTSEQERITLYEASLIRYFYPEYNKEFKDSFPSTNLKVLSDCYSKDFSAVVAEICIDELPFRLKSKVVAPTHYHIAEHDLHAAEDRRVFFGI